MKISNSEVDNIIDFEMSSKEDLSAKFNKIEGGDSSKILRQVDKENGGKVLEIPVEDKFVPPISLDLPDAKKTSSNGPILTSSSDRHEPPPTDAEQQEEPQPTKKQTKEEPISPDEKVIEELLGGQKITLGMGEAVTYEQGGDPYYGGTKVCAADWRFVPLPSGMPVDTTITCDCICLDSYFKDWGCCNGQFASNSWLRFRFWLVVLPIVTAVLVLAIAINLNLDELLTNSAESDFALVPERTSTKEQDVNVFAESTYAKEEETTIDSEATEEYLLTGPIAKSASCESEIEPSRKKKRFFGRFKRSRSSQ